MIQSISRRSMLAAGASAVTALLNLSRPAEAQRNITVDQFRALSAELTGVGVADLDAAVAGQLLAGFLSLGRGPELLVLAADPRARGGSLANEVVAAWYSGNYQTSTGAAAFDLTAALLWKSLDFTKPRGTCGGATGYWADQPQS
jgi:hypothetical protein